LNANPSLTQCPSCCLSSDCPFSYSPVEPQNSTDSGETLDGMAVYKKINFKKPSDDDFKFGFK